MRSLTTGKNPFSIVATIRTVAVSLSVLLIEEQHVSAFPILPSKQSWKFSSVSSHSGLFAVVPKDDGLITVISAKRGHSSMFRSTLPTKLQGSKSLQPLSSSSSDNGNGASDSTTSSLDRQAVLKYLLAIGMQMSAITVYFYLIDMVNIAYIPFDVPLPIISALFYLMSLRSRFFSPLDNRRPNLTELASSGKTDGYRDRIMPRWTPPGFFFPIMWILIIAPLRAYASTLIFQENGGFLCDPAILLFMLHLSIGDTWNTINNVERRLGASVIGVYLVFLSSLLASYLYFLVSPLAGKLLGLTCIWLAIASALVTQTWRLNLVEGGSKDKLYPVVGKVKTRFVFELPE